MVSTLSSRDTKSWLFSYRMDVKKLCLKACESTNAGVIEVVLVEGH